MKTKLILFFFLAKSFFIHAQTNPQLGATLQHINSFNSPSNWFVDIMKSSKPFSPVGGPWLQGSPALDPQGWPTEPFSVWVKYGIYPGDEGTYQLSFDGFANIEVFDTSNIISDKVYDPITNKTTASLFISSAASQVILTFNAPMSPAVRNIKLVSPGFNPQNFPTYRPEWLSHLSKFPVLRFMTWNAANLCMAREWNERRLVDGPTQCSFYTEDTLEAKYVAQGVAWEHIIELCNILQKDAWINIPVFASDNYVTQLANLLKNTLNPNLKVYIEYGNEMWSFATIAGAANFNEARKEVLAGNSTLNQGNETNEAVWSMRRYAKRSKEIAAIFYNVYGLNNPNDRIRPVLGFQYVSPESNLRKLLEYIQQNFGAPKNYFYGTASAPFIGQVSIFNEGMTVNDYLNHLEMENNRMFLATSNIMDQGLAWTKFYELNFLAHEAGGFHDASYTLPGNLSDLQKKAIRDTLAAAMENPRITTIYNDYLTNWFTYGGPGSVFTWFVAGATDYSLGDGFGLQKNSTDSLNIKNVFIQNFLQGSQPAQVAGQNIDQPVDTRKFAGYASTWNSVSKNTSIDAGLSQLYLLNVTASGSYQIRLVKDKATRDASTYQISVNNSTPKVINETGLQNPGVDTVVIGNFNFNKGANALQITNISRCYPNYAFLFDIITVNTEDHNTVQSIVYPNPASSNESMYIFSTKTISIISILNFEGKEIELYKNVNANHFTIHSPNQNGAYFVKLTYASGEMESLRIVVE